MSKSARRLRRRQPSRPGPAPRPMTNRQAFQLAMVEAELDDIRARGRPCAICGQPGRNGGVWLPSPAYAEYLGISSYKNKVMIYALCNACMQPGAGERVEEVIMTKRRAELAARDAGLDISNGVAYFQSPGDMERFSQAWSIHPTPA